MTNCLISKSKLSKIFPKNGNCCICYTTKSKFIRCSNFKCKDGIICFDCLEQMTPTQKSRCQICQIETSVFQKVQVKSIDIVIDNFDGIVIGKNKKARCKVSDSMQIVFGSLCLLLSTYSVGLLFLFAVSGKIATNINPIINVLIGIIIIMTLFGLCVTFKVCMSKKN